VLTADEVHHLSRHEPWVDAPSHVLADVPEWTAPSLEASVGHGWVQEGRAMTGRPPLDLRVNTLRSERERVRKALDRFGPVPTAISPVGLRIPAGSRDSRTPNVQVELGYLKGWFEVQDQGSQIVAALAGAQAGEQVLDLCAGAGGKTLAMAAAMSNKGQIFAYDSDRHRLAPIHDRLKRNGARNVQVRSPGEGVLDDLIGRMDRVVIDAPCTGTGTWRRRPDTKWKLSREQLDARVAEQAAILEQAATFVRPGGALIYITCSVLDEENAGQAGHFLSAHPEFEALPMAPLVDALHSGASEHVHLPRSGGVLLTPLRTQTDGFFAIVMRRR
jgi:16S rRNA (cytosine967-C5)-methyltransferase